MFTFVGCQEGMTLESADAVYIEIKPTNAYIMVGDTLSLSAVVTNVDGSIIDTPIAWSIIQNDIVKLEGDKIIALQGGQGKTANIRATLTNGKYALTNITVTNHVADGVVPVVDVKYTYGAERDTVRFMVAPKGLLHDYVPVIINSDEKNVIPHSKAITVDAKTGLVSYSFSSTKAKASAKITLKIGPDGSEKEGVAEVIVCPQILATLGSVSDPAITYESSKTMNVNSEDTVWVNTAVNPSYDEDLNAAKKYYDWSAVGNVAQLVSFDAKDVTFSGHNAYAIVRSSQFEGETKITFNCYGIKLTTTINVENYNVRYPVNELTVDKKTLSIPNQATVAIVPSVAPATSYPFHQPKFISSNPTVAKVMGYSGSEMFIKGLKPGKAVLTVTSNDKTITVPVTVEDNVNQVVFLSGNDRAVFVGSTIDWKADATTTGGSKVQLDWASNKENIATAIAGEIGIGKITGIANGDAAITAKAGGKQSTATIKVIPAPGNLDYTVANTNVDGNAVYDTKVRGEKVLSVDITPNGGASGLIHLYIRNYVSGSKYDGTFTAPARKIWFVADDAFATVQSGTITISDYVGDFRDVDVNLVVSIGGKQFTVKAKIKSY